MGQARLSGTFAQATASAAPTLAFDTDTVTVDQITPGGVVAVFGVMRSRLRHPYPEVLRVIEELTDDDQDGVVSFDVEPHVAAASVWAAIDVKTGAAVVGAPEGFEIREIDSLQRRVPAARVDQFEVDRRRLALLWHRPGEGVWRLDLQDGATDDAEPGSDGKIRAEARAFRSVGRSAKPPPAAFRRGDALFAVDPRNLDFLLVRFEDDPKGER